MFRYAAPGRLFARTLIQSYALQNVSQIRPLTVNAPINENNVNFQAWRLSKPNMQLLKRYAFTWLATCNFDKNGWNLKTETLEVKFKNFDLLENDNGSGQCTLAVKMNIRGETCQNCHVAITQTVQDPFHVNTDSSSIGKCSGTIPTTSATDCSEESFGLYGCVHENHTCAATPQSTTQHWIQ